MCARRARGGSQVSQTAARGRNRLAEFTGESLPAILNRSASHAEPIAEGGTYRQRPKATQAGAPAPAINGSSTISPRREQSRMSGSVSCCARGGPSRPVRPGPGPCPICCCIDCARPCAPLRNASSARRQDNCHGARSHLAVAGHPRRVLRPDRSRRPAARDTADRTAGIRPALRIRSGDQQASGPLPHAQPAECA